MKKLAFVLTLAALFLGCAPQTADRMADRAGEMAEALVTETPIVAALDLTAVSDDRVPVTADPGAFTEDEALIGMCNDIMVRQQSDGERSLITVMEELQDKYGEERPFADDSFIDEFEAFTTPEVGAFLRTHVVGTEPIDYNECLEPVGLTVREAECSGRRRPKPPADEPDDQQVDERRADADPGK